MSAQPPHRPRKRFGQHFLRDQQTIERILRLVDSDTDTALVEIGPGLGALTMPLLKRHSALTVVELDRDLIPRLTSAAAGVGDLVVHQADALGFDYTALAKSLGKQLQLVGNLPYNISTPLMFHLFEQQRVIDRMHFMLQQEVVDRLAAAPGDKAYGRLGIMAQYRCAVVPAFPVPPECFDPPPRVNSAVVSLLPRQEPPFDVGDFDDFQRVVTSAFSGRRKTLRNALSAHLSESDIRSAGVDPQARAERITPVEYAALSRQLGALGA